MRVTEFQQEGQGEHQRGADSRIEGKHLGQRE